MPVATLTDKRDVPPPFDIKDPQLNILRELPRKNKVMPEDFGFTRSSLGHYATQAERGDANAIAKLEPLRQSYLYMMSIAIEDRTVYEMRAIEGHERMVPVMEDDGRGGQRKKKVPRSRWDWSEDDMLLASTGKKKRAGYHKRRVEQHFYQLVQVLFWANSKTAPTLPDGRHHPKPELVARANDLLSGERVPPAAFNDPKTLRAEMEKVIKAQHSPQRADILRALLPYIVDGKKCSWQGDSNGID